MSKLNKTATEVLQEALQVAREKLKYKQCLLECSVKQRFEQERLLSAAKAFEDAAALASQTAADQVQDLVTTLALSSEEA
jgi:hypothetical protein